MIHLAMFERKNQVPVHRGLVELDLDNLAERYVLFDRRDMTALMHALNPVGNIARVIVPFDYTNGSNLTALIFDEIGSPSYNIAGADKIKAEIVDAKMANLNP